MSTPPEKSVYEGFSSLSLLKFTYTGPINLLEQLAERSGIPWSVHYINHFQVKEKQPEAAPQTNTWRITLYFGEDPQQLYEKAGFVIVYPPESLAELFVSCIFYRHTVFIAGLSPFAAISNPEDQYKIKVLQWGAEYFYSEINSVRITLADLLKSFDSSIAFFIHRTNKQAFDILTNARLQRHQIIPALKSHCRMQNFNPQAIEQLKPEDLTIVVFYDREAGLL